MHTRFRSASGWLLAVLLCGQVALADVGQPTLVRPVVEDGQPNRIVAHLSGSPEINTADGLVPRRLDAGSPNTARGTFVYDNTVNGPTGAYSTAPDAEIGDVLLMTGGDVLDDLVFSVYNSSQSTSPLSTADLLIQFYNSDPVHGAYVYTGGLVVDDASLNLDPGYFRLVTFSNLADLGILLADEVLVTLMVNDVTGGAEFVGQVLYDPPAVGSSDDYFFEDGGWYWFNGNPIANFAWAVGTVPGYCPAGSVSQWEFIARVTVGAIDNDPNNPPAGSGLNLGGYADFTDLHTNMKPGASYPIDVRLESGWSTDIVGVWIDWNRDSDFDDPDELTVLPGAALYYSGVISVPATVSDGPTRMRIRVQDSDFDPALSPCGYTAYGEVEDYTVNVGPLDLALEPTKTCYKQGDQVVIEIVLRGNDAEVLGGLFHLSYSDKLDFVSIDPGDAPFTEEEEEDVDEIAREITYTVAVPTNTPPVGYSGADPIVMARITFDILADDCDLADAVSWRDPGFPLQTRLSQLKNGMSLPLYADHLLVISNIRLDTTPPALSVPADTTVECVEDAAPALLYGTATGGIAIYYNDNGMGEHPWNQAYLAVQFGAGESDTGAAFLFDNTPLDGNGFTSWHGIYSGLTWPDSQFGLDMVLPAPTADGSVIPPVLNAYDNGDNSVGGRILRGPVTWAINDYKPHQPDITAGDVLNSIVSSELQAVPGVPNGGEVVLLRNDYTQAGTVFTSHIKGMLVSDGVHHWYTVGQPDSPMSNLGLNGTFHFEATLTYDSASDPFPLMDFYAGTITLVANAPSHETSFATATDSCTLFPLVWFEDADNGGAGCVGDPLVITRTWYAQDECGNVASGDQVITVIDDVAPEFVNCPDSITVTTDPGVCGATVTWAAPQVWDNCDGYLVPASTHSPGEFFAVGTTTVTYDVTDACGNASTCSFTITVNDEEPPQAVCQSITVQLDASGNVSIAAADVDGGSTDACGIASLSVSPDSFTCADVGDNSVTLTVTDVNGNVSTCTATVTVEDNLAPTITCPADVTVNADAGTCAATGVALGQPTTSDNCGVATVVNDAPASFPLGDTIVTWTVTDTNGNQSTCTQTVTVLGYNNLVVDVQIEGSLDDDVARCITFQFFDCSAPNTPVEFARTITFAYDTGLGRAEFTLAESDGIPCGDYQYVLVQDDLHTLTRMLELNDGSGAFEIGSGQYLINCTAATGNLLLQGDLYDDTDVAGVDFIDVVDLAVYIAEWGATYDSDGDLVPDGNTPCGMFAVHADLTGNGAIDVADRAFITTHYLAMGEHGVCPTMAGLSIPGSPRRSISVAELRALGLHEAARADLNRDGRVDKADINIFINGVPADSMGARSHDSRKRVPHGTMSLDEEELSKL